MIQNAPQEVIVLSWCDVTVVMQVCMRRREGEREGSGVWEIVGIEDLEKKNSVGSCVFRFTYSQEYIVNRS